MRFKIDENLPNEVADLLNESSHDAISVLAQALGGAPDPTVAKVCASERRVLVTLDLDFSDIRAYPPSEYAGILVLRPASQAKSHVLNLLRQVVEHLKSEELVGKLWIVAGAGIRIRETG